MMHALTIQLTLPREVRQQTLALWFNIVAQNFNDDQEGSQTTILGLGHVNQKAGLLPGNDQVTLTIWLTQTTLGLYFQVVSDLG